MPNWTNNVIVCRAEDLPKIWNADEERVDFELLMPMPDELSQTSGSITRDAIAYAEGNLSDEDASKYLYSSDRANQGSLTILGEDENGRYVDKGEFFAVNTFHFEGKDYLIETLDQFKRLGNIYLDNQDKYGAQTWYDWSCNNWGTKWNACDSDFELVGDYAVVNFNTAWSSLSGELLGIMEERFDYPFIIEAAFEDYDGTIYNPLTNEEYPTAESMLFEEFTEDWDGDEYSYPGVMELNAEMLHSLLG